MSTCKVFVIGPHDERKYSMIGKVIRRSFAASAKEGKSRFNDLIVKFPTDNQISDEFNDWIFGQIDTSDLVVADISEFNPNVVYEIAFAHSVGIPVIYYRTIGLFRKLFTKDRIFHYFGSAMLNSLTYRELRNEGTEQLRERIRAGFEGKLVASSTVMSSYYGGVPPIDSEFARGLAQTYYRNFLSHILTLKSVSTSADTTFRVVLPDTLEKADAEIGEKFDDAISMSNPKLEIGTNSQGRRLNLKYSETNNMVFDVPTILFTSREARRYQKVAEVGYLDRIDLDRIGDLMCRKFADELLGLWRSDRSKLGPLGVNFEIVWMSELVGNWIGKDEEHLLNKTPPGSLRDIN